MYINNKNHLSVFLAVSALCFGIPALASAATLLYFEAPTSSVSVGSAFHVGVLIDSDQPVNAYSVQMDLSGNALRLDGANNANSIITVWQDIPGSSAKGGIKLNGGSESSFVGTRGELITLNFTAVATGTVQFSFSNPAVYLANGKGTKITPDTKTLRYTVSESALAGVTGSGVAANQVATSDSIAPEVRFLSFISNPFGSDEKLLGFSVADAGSGIREVEARYRSTFFWSDWAPIKNPTPLGNDVWEVDFRATDNAGNTAEQIVYDWNAFWIFGMKIGGVLILICLAAFFARKMRKNTV